MSPRKRPRSSLGSLCYSLRVITALARNDIRSALGERLFSFASIIIPINFLLLFLLFVLSGGQAPTAVVLEDQGPYAQRFVAAMRGAHSFSIRQTSADGAQRLMAQGKIVAIVTVPSTFDDDLTTGRTVELPVVVNNLDVDFTNDIRRAVPLAITSFYADAFPDQVVVQARESDVQPHDTDYVPYLAVSIVVIGILLGGLLQAGIGAAREYETGTIKELLLSPASRGAIETGKVLGALVMNVLATLPVLLIVVLLIGVWPRHWGALLGFTLLVMAIFVALGTLIGTLVRRRQAVIPLSIGLALPLFFVSGAFGPVRWGSPIVAALAQVTPVYYAIALFQFAFHGFSTTPTSVLANVVVLGAFAVAAIVVSTLVLRRERVAH
jgi:ABC-type transport system involved in multi-copper enzyme maturation permease subunit